MDRFAAEHFVPGADAVAYRASGAAHVDADAIVAAHPGCVPDGAIEVVGRDGGALLVVPLRRPAPASDSPPAPVEAPAVGPLPDDAPAA
jgi:hypothetical protein